MRKRKLLVGGLLSAAGIAAIAIPAGAAPTNAKNALPITLRCSNGQTYTASVNGNGKSTPAVTAQDVVLVPFTLTVTFHDITTGMSNTTTVTKPGTPNADVFCTFASAVVPGGPNGDLIQITGSALAQVNPRTRA
jgi:hypothetical protein